MPKGRKNLIEKKEEIKEEIKTPIPELLNEKPKEETITITKSQFDDIQSKLKMLTEVADKGRVFNYENQQAGAKKKTMKVKLSEYAGGIITGWRTIKDVLVKHPSTGATIGEEQQYELLITKPDGSTEKVTVSGYSTFSGARYDNRIDCDVIGKREEFSGAVTLDVKLPDGRVLPVGINFVN